MSLRSRLYIWFTVGIGGFVVYTYLPGFDYQNYNLFVLGLLSLFALFSEVSFIQIMPGYEISVSTAIYISTIYIGGTSLAIIVALPSLLLSETLLRGLIVTEGASMTLRAQKAVFNISQAIVSIASAGIVFEFFGGTSPPFWLF
ncbi:hypothetical protein K9M06_04740 [Candidatus Bipolaricaulota bacterium]|nr:hypothetical protein [Candidatus Bipolaricaulota bacterium]